jgi:hypothetical protein
MQAGGLHRNEILIFAFFEGILESQYSSILVEIMV